MKWLTITTYVDAETGEIIDNNYNEQDYYIVKTSRYVNQPKRNESRRYIQLTKLVRRRPKQRQIF